MSMEQAGEAARAAAVAPAGRDPIDRRHHEENDFWCVVKMRFCTGLTRPRLRKNLRPHLILAHASLNFAVTILMRAL